MRSKVAGWLLYKLFIWASKNASFNDFTLIYNQAYAAHAEAEWTKLRNQMNQMNSQSTKSTQGVSVDNPVVTQRELPSNLTLRRLGLNAGQER